MIQKFDYHWFGGFYNKIDFNDAKNVWIDVNSIISKSEDCDICYQKIDQTLIACYENKDKTFYWLFNNNNSVIPYFKNSSLPDRFGYVLERSDKNIWPPENLVLCFVIGNKEEYQRALSEILVVISSPPSKLFKFMIILDKQLDMEIIKYILNGCPEIDPYSDIDDPVWLQTFPPPEGVIINTSVWDDSLDILETQFNTKIFKVKKSAVWEEYS